MFWLLVFLILMLALGFLQIPSPESSDNKPDPSSPEEAEELSENQEENNILN